MYEGATSNEDKPDVGNKTLMDLFALELHSSVAGRNQNLCLLSVLFPFFVTSSVESCCINAAIEYRY